MQTKVTKDKEKESKPQIILVFLYAITILLPIASMRMLAGVDIGFDADGCVGVVNKVVHTHYLLGKMLRP